MQFVAISCVEECFSAYLYIYIYREALHHIWIIQNFDLRIYRNITALGLWRSGSVYDCKTVTISFLVFLYKFSCDFSRQSLLFTNKPALRKSMKSVTLRLVCMYISSISFIISFNKANKFLCFRRKTTSQGLVKKIFLGGGR